MTLRPYACTKPCPRGCTILLVEDEPFVLEATCRILESSGFEVLPARDARQALKVFQACSLGIDLVMTDLVLPGRSGHQLGQDLRVLAPEVVILVTSGYGNPDYETEPAGSKIYFLSKPYSKRILVAKIENILGGDPLASPATKSR